MHGNTDLWAALTGLFLFAFILIQVIEAIYDVFFHPLANLPGPKIAAWSNIPYSYWFHGGRMPYKILDLHEKYGPVVRIAPNEVSFNSPQSWNDIYNFRQGHQTFVKSEFYQGGPFASRGVHSIVSERDVDEHGQMRRHLSHAFSDQSLREQEVLIAKTVDRFIEVVGERGSQSGGFNLGKGLEMMTFDIIGDLAFGETFGGVDSDRPHPWIDIAMGALRQGALADTFNRFPMASKLLTALFSSKIAKLTEETRHNEDMAIELVNKRIVRHEDARKDFMTRILEQRDPEKVSDLQLAAHASDFVVAGSETTATALSCILYYLFKNPAIKETLQKEVRSSFQSYDRINSVSTTPLKYLKAVILEGLRIYPPLPFALPRVVPAGGDTVDGHFLPAGTIVSTNPVAASLGSQYFSDPMDFKPERWLAEKDEVQGDILAATQPFSLGPRSCLGRNLAWLELRTVLAKLLWTYDMELVNNHVDWHRDSRMLTLWKKPPLWVKVERRA
ncbi:cytochrome P450 [Annulohypoxylon truncatum]|uniref:cytochrome P450 n=1 Tax=Annulohypoxylon truncatum TaxID=327061 RepID=UPI0020079D38|nr:cytochrome P450 [Annulohypoxylon truncatum]KAI1205728.1 cytochrome P450 [Annulohypoxylon truncatum]